MTNPPKDIRTTPVTSAKGRRWLARAASAGSALPQIEVTRNDVSGIDSQERNQDAQNDSHRQGHLRQKRPRASKIRPEVHVTSVEIPDVTLTKENCQLKAAQANLESSDSGFPTSDPKQIVAHLAEASDLRLRELAAEVDNAILPASPIIQQAPSTSYDESMPALQQNVTTTLNEPTVYAVANADHEEPSESWSTQTDPRKSRPDKPTTAPKPQTPPAPSSTIEETSDSLEMGYQPIATPAHPTSEILDMEGSERGEDAQVETNDADLESDDNPLTGVIESILAKKLSQQSTSLMFAGSEGNPLVDSTAANVCSLLARQRRGRVLLVDANEKSQQLSISSGAHGKSGWVEVVLENVDWRELVRSGAASGVDFLPIGNQPLTSTRYQSRQRDLMSQWKTEYEFVCLSVGDSDSIHAKQWSELCDGCYLLISQKNDNPAIARAAITELQTSGARLLGCVVTDSQG